MTNEELIAQLQKLPPHAKVCYPGEGMKDINGVSFIPDRIIDMCDNGYPIREDFILLH
jgi:uncharacterized protein (DUF1919 family)